MPSQRCWARACIMASCWLAGSSALAARATTISLAEAGDALKTYLRGTGKNPNLIVVDAIDGCYPVAGRSAQERLCLVRGEKKGDVVPPSVQEIGFRRRGGTWEMIDPETRLEPACPASDEALHLFKRVVRSPIEKISDQPSEGVFSDRRGLTRETAGPLRLMCSYGLSTAKGELTAVAYFQFIDGAYALDTDVEILLD